jgi:nucleoside-diphosphate-sugar epimerase
MNSSKNIKKIALIGANGFIGSAIYNELKTIDLEILPTSRSVFPNNNYIKFDLFDKSTWDILLQLFKPDIVICTAWDTEHDKYWDKDTNYDYMKATIEFATACFRANVSKFIGIGTMSEYGFSPGKCNSESSTVNPQDAYSEAKVLTSESIKRIANDFGKKANWVRLFQPYGKNEKSERLIPEIIKNMKQKNPVNIKFPNHMLDFTNTVDIGNALKFIAINDFEYYINVGTGVATSIRSLCTLLAQINHYPIEKVNFKESNDINERIIFVDPQSHFLVDNWSPKFNLSNGLEII